VNDLLAIDDLHTAYGLSRVLFGISLDIAAGECVCLLGRNGVGKTTTIRSVMGLVPPTSGRIVWKGTDIGGWSPHRVARAGIGYVPEDRRVFAEQQQFGVTHQRARDRQHLLFAADRKPPGRFLSSRNTGNSS